MKHVFSHHIRAAGRAFSSWHELGLTLPPNTVAPQSLADVLEQEQRVSYMALLTYVHAANLRSGVISFRPATAANKISHGNENTL